MRSIAGYSRSHSSCIFSIGLAQRMSKTKGAYPVRVITNLCSSLNQSDLRQSTILFANSNVRRFMGIKLLLRRADIASTHYRSYSNTRSFAPFLTLKTHKLRNRKSPFDHKLDDT